jgi:hypothetical protein
MFRNIFCFLVILFSFDPLFCQINNNNCPERISLVTDREEYIAGEWLYFNLFLNNSNTTSACLMRSKYVYMIFRDAKSGHISDNLIELSGPTFNGSIYIPDTLATGQYQIVAYTNFMRNYGEDIYFTKNIIVVNRFDTNFSFFDNNIIKNIADSSNNLSDKLSSDDIKINLSANKINLREKLNINIQVPDNKLEALVSVSVRHTSPLKIVETTNNVESPVLSVIDNCNYIPEYNSLIIQGKLIDEKNNPLPHTNVYLSTPDSITNLQYSSTDKNGIFRFSVNSFYDGKQLIIKVLDNDRAKIVMEDKFALNTPFKPKPIIVNGDIKQYLSRIRNIVNIQKSYNQYYKIEVPNSKSIGYRPLVYAKPNSVVYPSDFLYLPDFIEISREILPFLKTRFRNNEYSAEMLDLQNSVYVKPFIFLDGVLIDHVQQIIHLDTKAIYKIETLSYPRFLGNLFMPGILSVFSTKNEIKNIKWIKPTVTLQNIIKLPEAKFSSASAQGLNKHTPNFRYLLLWEPSVNITGADPKNFEIITSDYTGDFEILVKGVLANGKTIESRKVFTVTSNL